MDSGQTITRDARYFITSLTNIDVIFREDAARARKDNSPLNMNVLRKTALFLANQAKPVAGAKRR